MPESEVGSEAAEAENGQQGPFPPRIQINVLPSPVTMPHQPHQPPQIRMPAFAVGDDLRLFLAQLDIYFQIQQIHEVQDRVDRLALGLPSNHFATLTTVRQSAPNASWEQFTSLFLQAAGCALDPEADRQKLKQRRQLPGEPPAQFAAELSRLAATALAAYRQPERELIVKDLFIDNIISDEICRRLKAEPPASLQDAVLRATAIDNAEKAVASRRITTTTPSAPSQPAISVSIPAAQPSVTPSQSFTSASASELSINAFRQGSRRRRGTPNRREGYNDRRPNYDHRYYDDRRGYDDGDRRNYDNRRRYDDDRRRHDDRRMYQDDRPYYQPSPTYSAPPLPPNVYLSQPNRYHSWQEQPRAFPVDPNGRWPGRH